jgi:colanic acid biosynthesis glycosyl transferase WcaI
MGLGHDFTTLTDAMARLSDLDPAWLFIGDGPQKSALRERVRALGLRHVTFLPYRPRAELSASYGAADASIVSLEARVSGLLAPSKLYAVLAAGRPVVYVGPADGRTAELIRTHGVGVAARNGDGAGLADAIRGLHADPAARAAMGQRARSLFEERFTRARAVGRHADLLERVACF